MVWTSSVYHLNAGTIYLKVYPVSSSTGRRTKKWCATEMVLIYINLKEQDCIACIAVKVIKNATVWSEIKHSFELRSNSKHLDLVFHWISRSIHLTLMGDIYCLATSWSTNKFENGRIAPAMLEARVGLCKKPLLMPLVINYFKNQMERKNRNEEETDF